VILPLLLSVPHAGTRVPPEVADDCILGEQDIIRDGDEGAAELYRPLKPDVAAFVTSDIARAIVDLNRAPDDHRKDGVVKTHTCYDVPVYRSFPSEALIRTLLERYYRPYHAHLKELARSGVRIGVDCHTMAAIGPPTGPDPDALRPLACLSNANGTCPQEWIESLAAHLGQGLGIEVAINEPFKGGYITRHHARELPWLQLELSREQRFSDILKPGRVLSAFRVWCREWGWLGP
jgi:formiminoglutamase